MSEQTTQEVKTQEKVQEKPKVNKKKRKAVKKKAAPHRKIRATAPLTTEAIAALFEKEILEIDGKSFQIKLKLPDKYDDDDLENLQTAHDELGRLIDNIEGEKKDDELDDEDDEFDDYDDDDLDDDDIDEDDDEFFEDEE